ALKNAGLQAEVDARNEKISFKVREHSTAHVPVILAVGRKEVEEGTVAMRRLGSKEQTTLSLDEVVATLSEEATPPDLR
ncbi:MAG: His/Gly/Thr/Pro-type tRNA ligase C-terminal domain-containing protein, partial [Pseudomonadota bacterium]